MKQLLITTHLYTFAVICVIATTISSCTFKKKTDMETPTGTKENELTMLVGTYTSGDSKGIYSFRFNEETGTATALSETEVENPSYLAVSADGKFIYTVSEFNNEQAAANAFAFNQEKGTLKLLNSQKTGGEDPCYIITNGNNVITANYSGGSISVFPIAKDGSLLPASDIIKFEGSGTDKERQEKSIYIVSVSLRTVNICLPIIWEQTKYISLSLTRTRMQRIRKVFLKKVLLPPLK